jgi:5-methyltetrahydrofolate corrinoid/iron sulfur protein methyltransferase
MIAVAERINGMFKDVRKAVQKKDKAVIADLAQRQTAQGAKYLDINVGTAAADQLDAMRWLVETVQSACKTPIALDSQKLPVIQAGLEICDGRPVMINSVSGDPEKLDVYMPLAVQHNASLVALTLNVEGVPQNIEKRVEIAMTIVAKAMEHGLDMPKVFIDPIILPVTVDQKQPMFICEVVKQIKTVLCDPPPSTIVGLSNISQGTSMRPLINRICLVMLQAYGLDAAIIDVLDTEIMDAAITADMLMNRFIYSDSYLKAARM